MNDNNRKSGLVGAVTNLGNAGFAQLPQLWHVYLARKWDHSIEIVPAVMRIDDSAHCGISLMM